MAMIQDRHISKCPRKGTGSIVKAKGYHHAYFIYGLITKATSRRQRQMAAAETPSSYSQFCICLPAAAIANNHWLDCVSILFILMLLLKARMMDFSNIYENTTISKNDDKNYSLKYI